MTTSPSNRHPDPQDLATRQLLSRLLAALFWTLLVGLLALSTGAIP